MPRGRPKKPISMRLDPDLIEEVGRFSDNLTEAIEEALRDWIACRKKSKM
jgi:uncharacterized protein (DUF4415 family)